MIKAFWLILGYKCNNRCPHCYASPKDFVGKWMPFSYIKEVATTLFRGNVKEVLLIGGEPTLYPHLIETISFCSNLGLKTILITNGRRLKNEAFTASIFNAGLNRAVISLLGAKKETHNACTGCESFEETINGLQMAAKIGRANTLTIICKTNKDEIAEIICLAYKLGASGPVLNCAIPSVGEKNVDAKGCLPPQKVARIIENTYLTLGDTRFFINATFPICLLDKDILQNLLERKQISIGCQMYRGEGVAFDSEGNILPCTHFGEMPLIEFTENEGAFTIKDTFLKIWEDSKSMIGSFRSDLWRYPAKK